MTDRSILTSDRTSSTTARDSHRTGPSGPVLAGALVGFVAVAQLAGLIGIPFTDRAIDSWYDQLDKPFFNPPSWVFAPVWTALYLLIGVAAWLVWRSPHTEARRAALTWWGLQLVLNAAWTPLFFGAQALWVAFIEIVVLLVAIVVTVVSFRRVHQVAAWLLVPYLLWVSFATVLNGTIAAMN